MNVTAVRVEGNTLQQDQNKSEKRYNFSKVFFMPLFAAYILYLSDIYIFYMHEIIHTEFFRQFKRLSREIL